MKLTQIEIIKLITRLYTPLSGYWVDEISECSEADKFLKEGCLSLEEEHKDKYIINAKGGNYLHPYIEAISVDFIKFMQANQYRCANEGIVDWYMKKYNLEDIDLAKEIAEYICKNLETYHYKATSFHSLKIGNGYEIEKSKIE